MDQKRMGLGAQEVELARETHGENRFTRKKREGFFSKFFHGFSDPVILSLIFALILNTLVSSGEALYESAGIALAILLSVTVSTLSEYSGERAFEKLSEDAEKVTCRVRRGGKLTSLPAADLVVGDVVLLCAGERIPADGAIVFGEIGVDQSTLNGESRETLKHPAPHRKELSDAGFVFSSTFVSHGEAEMVVEHVGDKTLYGKLASQLQDPARESPLKQKLSHLAKTLSKIGYCAAAVVALSDLCYTVFSHGGGNLLSGIQLLCQSPQLFFDAALHALTLAITIVVVAVPEGLPMMVTVVLSSKMRKMLKEGVLVKKLTGIETAGNMDLLFCDKTGTLTEGTHGVQKIFSIRDGHLVPYSPDDRMLVRHFLLNNQAMAVDGKIQGSNATDRALYAFAKDKLPLAGSEEIVGRTPFDSATKYATVTLSDGKTLYKGAPEKLLLLARSVFLDGVRVTLSEKARRVTLRALRREEEEGARILAFAEGRGDDLCLLFFASLSDHLRHETRETVHALQEAGVQIVMLTGDSEHTACAIAKQAGIFQKGTRAIHSSRLSEMDDAEIARILPTLAVVYRCTPEHKSRLATIAAERGRVTGMTGDGVNDAPALKLADIGFAMGSGTQIAKDASDIVLTDDRLSSLKNAVLYGRTILRSIAKFVTFQLTMNFCAVLVSFLGPLFGVENPITVMQMLWVNLIMDTLASLAFAGEAPRHAYLKTAPLRRTSPILTRKMGVQIFLSTLYCVTLSCLFLQSETIRCIYSYQDAPTKFYTAFFLLFIFLGVFNLVNVRTPRIKLWAEIGKNPAFVLIFFAIAAVQIGLTYFGSDLFRCVKLDLPLLTLPIVLALTIIPADLFRKSFSFKRRENS